MAARIRPAARGDNGRFIPKLEVEFDGVKRSCYFADLQAPEVVARPVPGIRGKIGTLICVVLGVGP
ncbi:MAG TPA: hypothetical protein VMW80_00270 [Candidatus Dormibacteraeota bacterium]|nr:hypothetical protein [Candidatus Dormibacteraeota bacterium]